MDIELYFWLADLGVLRDLEGKKTKFEEVTVTLPRRAILSLLNGVLVSNVIFALKEEIVSLLTFSVQVQK